jgi:DNA-binding PadR family transcriptional regulator
MSEAHAKVTDVGVGPELTAFQQNILVILTEEPRYGLAIKRELEEYYGTDVNHGRLYPNLDDLVEMGLVEKSELDKRTNQYALTDAGVDVVVERIDWIVEKFVTDDDRADRLADVVEAHR